MSESLLVLWLATLGADRVDFLAGTGPFLLTPFLVLTPLVLGLEVARLIGRGGTLRVPAGGAGYLLLATALLGIGLVSVMFSLEIPLAAKRFALLLIQLGGTFLGVIFIANHERPERILVRGAYLGLALVVVFNVIQVAIWLSGGAASAGSGKEFLFLEPWMYGPWVPRLSGPAIDMNRGGFLSLVYLFLLIRFARPSRTRALFLCLAALSVVATLSRSTALALVVTCLLLLQPRALSFSRRGVLAAGVAGAGVTALLLVFVRKVVEVAEYLAPALSLRLLGDGSSSIHFALMRHGVEVGTASVKNALLGVGFGNSFAVLEDFFPGDKYGNFHSLYLSLWVETGVVALFLGLALMAYPFYRSRLYRPLLGGVLFFNIFYQTTLEPAFWFVLAAAWTELAAPADQVALPAAPEPETASLPLRRPVPA